MKNGGHSVSAPKDGTKNIFSEEEEVNKMSLV